MPLACLVVPLFDPIVKINELHGSIDADPAAETHQRPEAEAIHVKLDLTVSEVADDATNRLTKNNL